MVAGVRFWLDPVCPWTWITYNWLREVQISRGFELELNFISLAMLNPVGPDNPRYASQQASLGFQRVMVAAQRQAKAAGESANDVTAAFYQDLGRRLFGEKAEMSTAAELQAEVLAELGLPPSLGLAADDATLDADIKAQHDQALDLVGVDVGSPVIAVGDVAVFGPVMSPAPHGEEALRAWDGCLALASTPGFFELKRTRRVGPIFSS